MDRRNLLKLGALGAGTAALSGCLERVPGVNGDEVDGDGEISALSRSPHRSKVEPTGETKAFDLYLDTSTQQVAPSIEIPVWAFSDSPDGPFEVPGPVIRANVGDELRINFHNFMDMIHTIHWHGVHLPWDQDGTTFISQEPVGSGESFKYEFLAQPAGTHWYHCHVDAAHHIDMGMFGPLIIDDPTDPWRVGGPNGVDSEEIIVIDEVDQNHVHSAGAYANTQDPQNAGPDSGNPIHTVDQAEQVARDVGNRPPNPTVEESAAATNPAQNQRDWYPETYPPYEPNHDTFLMNGYSFPYTDPVRLKEGETKRLRFINAGHEWYTMHIHGHTFLVTHEDGHLLENPYWKDTLSMGPGERYDAIVFADNPGVWVMHDHSGHAKNNHTFPGGIFTAVVYEEYEEEAFDGQQPQNSGEYIRWYENL